MKKIIHDFKIHAALFIAVITATFFIPFYANAQTFATDVSVPAAGNVFIGITGNYLGSQQKALDRINAIRYEACKEGVINPATGQKLTISDYVEIKWSSDLEQIARIRAAESALTMQHVRTNGSSCFSISSGNVRSYGEVLAWGGSTLVDSVNMWYQEKSAWVHNTGAVTGHYTSMINPNNTYVGLGGFVTSYCSYKTSMAGEFNSSSAELSDAMLPAAKNAVQTLEIPADKITSLTLKSSGTAYVGESDSVYAKVSAWNASFPLLQATWNSSDSNTVSVDQNGNVSFIKAGTAVISAAANGKVFTLSLTVASKPTVKTPSWKSLSAGKKKMTVKWKKVSSHVSGYQIQYSTGKSYSSYKTVKVSGNKTTGKVIKSLKSKKYYYVRLRTYYKYGGKTFYSNWSKSKKVKIK